MAWTTEQIEETYQEIRKRLDRGDKDLRSLVLSDPRKAIEEVSGREVPDTFKIKMIEADPNYHMTYVIPAETSEVLSDDELEKVAGGGDCFGAVDACAGNACGANKG